MHNTVHLTMDSIGSRVHDDGDVSRHLCPAMSTYVHGLIKVSFRYAMMSITVIVFTWASRHQSQSSPFPFVALLAVQ